MIASLCCLKLLITRPQQCSSNGWLLTCFPVRTHPTDARGRSPKMLEGLRKRISTLFLSFVETPEFNPVSSQFQVVPMVRL